MKKTRYDENGIPILSRSDIDKWSEDFILYFDKEALNKPRMTPIYSICERLKREKRISLVFNYDLGNSPEGYKYRGRFHIPSSTIFIDKSLEWNDPRFNFTLAHELAHFVLHRKINIKALIKNEKSEISDTNRQLILDHVRSDNPRDWMEWQANKFASSLLLPRKTVSKAVVEGQVKFAVTRNFGKIYLDKQELNIDLYRRIMDHLVEIYETSKTSIKLRLFELNILFELEEDSISHNSQFESVGQIMPNVFKQLWPDY